MPLANLLARGLFALIAVAAFKPLSAFVASWPLSDSFRVVAWHIAFNGVMALAALPLAGLAMQAMTRLLPDTRIAADQILEPRYLDRSAFETPRVALSNAQQETVRMTELLDRMFDTAIESLNTQKLEPLKSLKLLDDRLNGYQDAIHAYLVDLTREELSTEASRRALEIMLYVSNIEHAGDILQLNLADRLKAKVKQSIAFSKGQSAALEELTEIVRESIKLACTDVRQRCRGAQADRAERRLPGTGKPPDRPALRRPRPSGTEELADQCAVRRHHPRPARTELARGLGGLSDCRSGGVAQGNAVAGDGQGGVNGRTACAVAR